MVSSGWSPWYSKYLRIFGWFLERLEGRVVWENVKNDGKLEILGFEGGWKTIKSNSHVVDDGQTICHHSKVPLTQGRGFSPCISRYIPGYFDINQHDDFTSATRIPGYFLVYPHLLCDSPADPVSGLTNCITISFSTFLPLISIHPIFPKFHL